MYDQQSAYGSQQYGNSSGQGVNAVLPPELQGLNWGGFLLNWIWGIGNNVWIALAAFIPFIGWLVPFYLLFKGNELAWKAKQWDSVEHFKATQRKWMIAGLIVLGIGLVCAFISIIMNIIAAGVSSTN